ncbi:MAG: hypothetical protein QXO65_03725 [Candidatus Aenigmatarchaeota archaeon]
MIDKNKLQEAIYKYEYLLKDARAIKEGLFSERVFEELLGSKENEVYDAKQNYCKRDSQYFTLELTKKELTKKFLYILQIIPSKAIIHYYKIDLQKFLDYIKNNMTLYEFHKNIYKLGIYFDDSYKYKTFSNECIEEYIDDLRYNNPSYEELKFNEYEEEKIQKKLLKQEGMNFEEMPSSNKGFDIKIKNIIIELKATKHIQKKNNNTSFSLDFEHARKTADYFVLSYIFEDEQNMLNIIMKNYKYDVEHISIYVPKEFVDIVNDKSLSDEEKIEKIKQIHIQYNNHELKFYTTREVKEFFENL